MPIISERPLIIWRLTDGKPGHEKQTLGLSSALGRIGTTQTHSLPAPAGGLRSILSFVQGRFHAGGGLPSPDLIIGAGHATHLPMLAAKRAHGGRTVVLMKPSLPLSLFDLCLIPEHDAPPDRVNVIPTIGALNNLTDGKNHDASRGLFLVGGPSPHFRWDSETIRDQIMRVAAESPGTRWVLSTSRRTPPGFLDGLRAASGIECFPVEETGPGWLEAQLNRADRVWSTPDSVSMVYEALSAGCHVCLFDLAPVPGSRVARGVGKLVAEAYVETFDARLASAGSLPMHAALDEAGRCAGLIMKRWFQ